MRYQELRDRLAAGADRWDNAEEAEALRSIATAEDWKLAALARSPQFREIGQGSVLRTLRIVVEALERHVGTG